MGVEEAGDPAFLVKKAGGKDYRIVADCRKVNSLTIPGPVEIPVLLEAVDTRRRLRCTSSWMWEMRSGPVGPLRKRISTHLGNLCSNLCSRMMGQGEGGSPFTLTGLMDAVVRDERLGLSGERWGRRSGWKLRCGIFPEAMASLSSRRMRV